MESTVTQDLEGHSVWLPEIKMEPEDNDESASEPRVIEVEPTLPEFASVKLEPADPVFIECHPEIEDLHESDEEPTSPPGTPTHSTTLDNITSQLDQVTHESSKTQLQFDFQRKVYVDRELEVNQCTVCNKVFSTKYVLHQHLLIHSDKRDHKCDECGDCFKTKGNLNSHLQMHKRHERRTSEQSRSSHIKYEHTFQSDGVRHVCYICSKSYSHDNSLTAHLKTHNVQFCEICNLKCSNLPALRTHMKVAHEGEKKRRCETCGKRFMTREGLTKHEYVHITKTFQCSVCSNRFLTNDRLERHVKNHHKNKQFECDICTACFTNKEDLNLHQKLHTEPEEQVIINKTLTSCSY